MKEEMHMHAFMIEYGIRQKEREPSPALHTPPSSRISVLNAYYTQLLIGLGTTDYAVVRFIVPKKTYIWPLFYTSSLNSRGPLGGGVRGGRTAPPKIRVQGSSNPGGCHPSIR
eukprot:518004-Prorocentrum_minimum.AAC.1